MRQAIVESTMTRRRILTINPNSSAAVTAAIDQAVAPLRIAGGPEIVEVGLAEGPPSITSQRDADSVVMPLVNRVARDGADSFVIACFSDPGLHAVREAAGGRPVMGIAGGGILRARTLRRAVRRRRNRRPSRLNRSQTCREGCTAPEFSRAQRSRRPCL
jgi:hypothetical protein